jgi:trypsin
VVALVGSLLLMSAAPMPLAEAHHLRPIQPGAQMTAPNGCTMNFIFGDQSGKLYIGTAGHCANAGQSVSLGDIANIGTVAWDSTGADFAMVAISPALYSLVDPAVRHWGGPTGVAAPTSTPGTLLYHYGYGLGFSTSELTRPRVGELTMSDGQSYLAETSATFGDSGSPFIAGDGKAVGVVSEYAFDAAHTDRGPTVAYIIQRAQVEKGLTLHVVTAPLTDAVERTIAQLEHVTVPLPV